MNGTGMAEALTGQAGFALRGRNPDVLTCIANLSNDEVFTPPEFANRMLDTLAEAWAASHDGAAGRPMHQVGRLPARRQPALGLADEFRTQRASMLRPSGVRHRSHLTSARATQRVC